MKQTPPFIFALCLLSSPLFAVDIRDLILEPGRSMVVELDFDFAKQDVVGDIASSVSVSATEGASTAVVSAGEQPGRCQIRLYGEEEEDELVINLEVNPLLETEERLRSWLSAVRGIRILRGKSQIVVSGFIDNASDWERFKKILALSDFRDKVDDLVEFKIAQEELDALADRIRKTGVPVAESGSVPKKGEVRLKYRGTVLDVSGFVWSPEQASAVLAVLRKTPWLKIVEEVPEKASMQPVVPTIVSLAVADDLLEVVFGAVIVRTDRLGDGEKPLALALRSFLSDGGRHELSLSLEENVSDVIAELTEMEAIEGRSMVRSMLVRSGVPGDSDLHMGGHLTVVPSDEGGGPVEPQEFDYGVGLKNRKTRLLNESHVEAEFSVDVAGFPEVKDKDGAFFVNQQRRSFHPSVSIELGRSIALSSFLGPEEVKKLFQKIHFLHQSDAGDGAVPENLELLILVGVERTEER